MKADVVVLGAGMVGTAIAAHLQKRGRHTVLLDRKQPGQETSFGNAGLIQREGVIPYGLPRDAKVLLDVVLKRSLAVNYHASALPGLAPFLWRYWRNSAPARHAEISRQYATLIEHCVTETRALADEAGLHAFLRASGWTKVFRTAQGQDKGLAEAEALRRDFGIDVLALDQAALRQSEPHLNQSLLGGIHYTQPDTVNNPGGFVQGAARYFERIGGRFMLGDGGSLAADGDGWTVMTEDGPLQAKQAVVALGPWSAEMAKRMGYRMILAPKRGYHMHYSARGNAVLNRPTLDVERGYMMAPMQAGIRITTGAEFARRDAPKTPVQLDRVEVVARDLFPLDARKDAEPWMGRRPCTPDMMPVIGPAPRHRNLWFAFGHAHHGLTLGALTGRLVAELVTGERPLVDLTPFRADRPALS